MPISTRGKSCQRIEHGRLHHLLRNDRVQSGEPPDTPHGHTRRPLWLRGHTHGAPRVQTRRRGRPSGPHQHTGRTLH